MTPRFQGTFTQQLPIPEEGIERAVAVMRSGRLHRYNVIDDEVPETVQLENELAAYMGASDDTLRLLHAVRQACRGSGRRRVRPGSPRHAELLGAHGQSESGDAELGLSTTDRPGERPESAAVSRRPSALLDRSVLEQLSRRTNLHGLAYFLGHHRFTQVPGKDPSLVAADTGDVRPVPLVLRRAVVLVAQHHLFPKVPFHALPAAHDLVGDRIVVEPRGYLAGQWQIIQHLLEAGSAARPGDKAQSPLL